MTGTGGPRVRDGVEDQAGEVDGGGLQGAARVQAGQQQQVVDHRAHAGRLGGDALQGPGDLRRQRAGVQQGEFGVAAHRGDRSAQFVAGVGGEAAQPFLAGVTFGEGVLDMAEHAVEGAA